MTGDFVETQCTEMTATQLEVFGKDIQVVRVLVEASGFQP